MRRRRLRGRAAHHPHATDHSGPEDPSTQLRGHPHRQPEAGMRARADDSGAALILVLIIVTVLSLGLSAVLSLTDTSVRATVALRAQASETYAADAAAKIAIDH